MDRDPAGGFSAVPCRFSGPASSIDCRHPIHRGLAPDCTGIGPGFGAFGVEPAWMPTRHRHPVALAGDGVVPQPPDAARLDLHQLLETRRHAAEAVLEDAIPSAYWKPREISSSSFSRLIAVRQSGIAAATRMFITVMATTRMTRLYPASFSFAACRFFTIRCTACRSSW
jgi:hypothetical protein